MSDEELLEERSRPNPDAFIQHCFKQYKLRERFPGVFLKLKPTRFGPPAPRRRIIIAPPMQRTPLPSAKPHPPEPLDQKPETFTAKEHIKKVAQAPKEDDKVRELDAWIEERKKLQNLLSKCGDVESWLMRKEHINEQEAHVLTKIKESKEAKEAQIEVQSDLTSNTEELLPKKKKKRIVPLIKAPYPETLINLQNLLHKQKLKLVDIFTKEDRSKTMKFKRADFIRVIKGTQVPINKNDLEDVVTYLTSTKKGNYITFNDLAECQRIWLEYLRDQWKHAKEAKLEELPPVHQTTDQKADPMTVKMPSCHSKSKVVPSQKPTSNYLEVPPINTEPDRMPLTYNTMEEVGKRYKEVRRRMKRKSNPLEWAEGCRVVKTGDPVVDNHCLPSSIEGGMGELVDQHRMACHLVWFQCVKICERYGIPLTEELLKRALLFPGDRLLSYDGLRHKLRQPGGYYETHDQQRSLNESSSDWQEQPTSPSKEKERSSASTASLHQPVDNCLSSSVPQENCTGPLHEDRFSEQEAEPSKPQGKDKPIWGRWKSYMEFRTLMRGRSKRLKLAAKSLWEEGSFNKLGERSQMLLEEKFIESEMRKMFDFLNPKTDPNSFWPGHLLDKLRLYLPQVGRARGDALFSHVSCTCPAYPGIYHPHRTWRVSEMNFVTYGDPETRKHYYYI